MPLFITATGPGMQGGLGQLQLYRDLCGESLHHRYTPEAWAAHALHGAAWRKGEQHPGLRATSPASGVQLPETGQA